MKLKDALEIVLGLAEDNALNLTDPEVRAKAQPATLEADQAQQEALKTVRWALSCIAEICHEPHR